jgi:flagellar hook-associated protein 1
VSDGAGGLDQGQTFTDAWASALANIGVRVQGAKSAAQMSAQVASGAKASLASYSGVNLDEEAARLMQFQQGYQAAAKVLQIAQSLFDTLLQTAG